MLKKRVVCGVMLLAQVHAVTANAGSCCNDFWSCAGAVATGGVSCAVDEAINQIRTFQQMVQTIRNAILRGDGEVIISARESVMAAVRNLTNGSQASERDFQYALQIARKVQSGQTVTPKDVARGAAVGADAVRSAMLRGAKAITSTQSDFVRDVGVVASASAQGVKHFEGQVVRATLHAASALKVPLDNLDKMLDDLVRNPAKLSNPGALVSSMLSSVTNALGKVMTEMTDLLLKDASASINVAGEALERAQLRAEWAKRLAVAMENANTQRTQESYDVLMAMLPAQGGSSSQASSGAPQGRPGKLVTGKNLTKISEGTSQGRPGKVITVKTLTKVSDARLTGEELAKKYNAELTTGWEGIKIKQKLVARPVVSASVESAFDRHADAMLGRVPANQIESKRKELLSEARSRFSRDPATLDKVINTINKEVDSRKKEADAAPTSRSGDQRLRPLRQAPPKAPIETR